MTGHEVLQFAFGVVLIVLGWLWTFPGWVWLALLAIFVFSRDLTRIGNNLHAIASELGMRRAPRPRETADDDDDDWMENKSWYDLGAKEERERIQKERNEPPKPL